MFVFPHVLQAKDRYFLDSGDKVRFFFEKDSFDESGSLKMDKEKCLNKIGHSLHWHVPAFKKVSESLLNEVTKLFTLFDCILGNFL